MQGRLAAAGERARNGRGKAGGLLSERRVTADAALVLIERVGRQIEQLAENARPHRSGVQRRSPVGQLLRVAAAAGIRVERRFDRGEPVGRAPLRRERARPVVREEFLDRVLLLAARGEQGAE